MNNSEREFLNVTDREIESLKTHIIEMEKSLKSDKANFVMTSTIVALMLISAMVQASRDRLIISTIFILMSYVNIWTGAGVYHANKNLKHSIASAKLMVNDYYQWKENNKVGRE